MIKGTLDKLVTYFLGTHQHHMIMVINLTNCCISVTKYSQEWLGGVILEYLQCSFRVFEVVTVMIYLTTYVITFT